jgi:hypothetical protein
MIYDRRCPEAGAMPNSHGSIIAKLGDAVSIPRMAPASTLLVIIREARCLTGRVRETRLKLRGRIEAFRGSPFFLSASLFMLESR